MNETKKCRFCRSEIDEKAKVCPICKRNLNYNVVLGVIVFVVVFILILSMIPLFLSGSNDILRKTVSSTASEDEYITLAEFNSIEMGMSYKKVADIVGSAGTISAESSTGGITVRIVQWYGNGVVGSNANVTFTNNEVTGKAQIGLE